jgi:hypothetical protein
MTSKSPRKKIDPARYKDFEEVAANFYEGAKVDHKNKVSYSGDIYHKKDIDSLWKHLERYRTWVNEILK